MEILDIVDSGDNVVGQTSREEIYSKKLHHRICHVLIFDNQNRMVLQKRSNHVSFFPDHWSTAVGGHVQTGETYEQAALREYKEELGANSPLTLMRKDLYQVPNGPAKFLATFKTNHDGPYTLEESAISSVHAFNLEEIKKMIEKKEKFHPELLFILNKYFL